MMLLRKSDRLEEILRAANWDVFGVIESQPDSGDDGTALAEIRDLRRYLLLVEAEMLARLPELRPSNVNPRPPMPPAPSYEEHAVTELNYEKMAAALSDDPEPSKPITPDDGGHHAKPWELDDGTPETVLSIKAKNTYYFRPTSGSGLLVDRRTTAPSLWEHLPRLRSELNNKEYESIQPYYRALFSWIESESKWRMKSAYVEHWGM